MILVDIGNTNLQFGLTKKGKISKIKALDSSEATKAKIKKIISTYPKEDEIILCSVAPHITKLFKGTGRKTYVVGKDIKIPLKSYYNKKNIGMDRLVGAYAARKISPRCRLIIDFGTAITFDFISKKGEYLGGFILPGVGSTLSVFSKCALLPKKIILKKVKKIIPTDTQSSISKGLNEGFSHMINSLFHEYKKKLKLKNNEIPIITGGDADIIMPYLNFKSHHEPLLVMNGLQFLAINKRKKRNVC